ncbi:RNA-directed DNA polymerase, eukaryota, reverse transcriptase zinc-binding domain protein [Tanacetum coccineum]
MIDVNGMEKVEDSVDENSLADLNDLNDLKETIKELASNEIQHPISKENMDQEYDINKVSPESTVSSDLSRPPEDVAEALPDVRVTVIGHLWSDHNPILLHVSKSDFGPTLFKLFHSWLLRDSFDEVIKTERVSNGISKETRTPNFSRAAKAKRRAQMIHGIMKEGVWIPDPSQIKEEFLNFFKEKFKAHDSNVDFPPFANSSGLCALDRDNLETLFSLHVVKNAVWDCSSSKAPDPDGFSFAFVKKYCDYIKVDILEYVNIFLDTGSLPHGSNSSFFTLIPKVSNSIFIKYFRPISLIGVYYKTIAKILADRLAKVIDKIVSHEQSAFIVGHQILDDPLILSEIVEWFKKKKKLLIFKVDFEKDFDLVFYLALGLKINIQNSNVYGIGVSDVDVSSMDSNSGCAYGSFPFTYLGGCHTLIKDVLGSLGIYYFSIFKVSETVLNSLERSQTMFLGGGSHKARKLAWIKWKNVISSYDNGGLNIGSLKAFNLALLQKWRWRYNKLYRLESEKDCLIIDCINHGQWRWNWLKPNLRARNFAEINEVEDTCVWSLGTDGTFSVKDARCIIDSKIPPSLAPSTV